ncbi:MAG: nitroreductase family protein [Gammaproteobacteria bacterium]
MINKPALTETPIHEIIQNRWSPRAFDPTKPLTDDIVLSLLEAARWAPSCMNEQPWRFLVCIKQKEPEAWQGLLACLAEKNREWAQHAPALLLSVAKERFDKNQKPNRWAAYDTGAATMSLVLQAAAQGLVAHQMGGFDLGQCRSYFKLTEDCTPMAVIAIGYQAEADRLTDEMKQRERAPRERLALSERFYFGRWG